jgi:hypoxanthine phosphoribosyltransferase
MDREILDWTTFGTAARELAQTIVDDGYRPDVVLSIARGGLLLGGALAYALGVKSCYLVNVEYYTGVDQRLDAPMVLPPALDLEAARGARVLIADDVADTGHTLKLVQDLCTERVARVRTAVLYEKSRSVVQCEYVWRRTDQWVVFPWSGQPSLLAEASTREPDANG